MRRVMSCCDRLVQREDVIGDWPSFVEQDIKTRATPIADTAAETAVQERRAEQRAKGEAGGSDGSGDSKSSKRGGGRSDGDGGDAGLSDSKLSILASGDDETVSAESFELVSVYAREAHNCLHVYAIAHSSSDCLFVRSMLCIL